MRRRALVIIVAAMVISGFPREAWADYARVLLARPLGSGASESEIVHRVRGELVADGFDVMLIDTVKPSDRVSTLVRAARAAGEPVTAGLFVEDGAAAIELRLVDGNTGRSLTRRVEAPVNASDQTTAILARRSVDLLRASLLEFLVESLRGAMAEARDDRRPRTPPFDDKIVTNRWALEAGLGVMGSFDGVGAAFAPLLRARFAPSDAFHLRVTGTWLGTRPRVQAPTGSASVQQGLALVEGLVRAGSLGSFRPVVSLGAGPYFVGIDGRGAPPYPGLHKSQWALAFDAGVGMTTPLGPRFEIMLEAHAIVTTPGIAIRFLDVDAATLGRPSLLAALTLAGWI